jgi:mono/diheme cytochrome c family protein
MKKLKIIFTACLMISGFVLMSAFTQKQDMWDAPKSADARKNPFKGDIAATLKGKALFEKQCAMCHGSNGKGNGSAAADLKPAPTDLTAKMTQSHTDGALYWKIMNGNSPMPSWRKAHQADHRQCWQLINYIRTFAKQSPKMIGKKDMNKMGDMNKTGKKAGNK